MVFRFELSIQVPREGDGIDVATSIDAQITYQSGRWRAQCQQPPAASPLCESFEQALVALARELVQEWREEQPAAVV
jgi:hypothetical protein